MQSVGVCCSLGRRNTHLVIASLCPGQTFNSLWWLFVVYGPGSCAPCAPTQKDSAQPFVTWGMTFWKGHSSHQAEKVQLFFVGGGLCIAGSAQVAASLRVCCFPLLPLLQGHLNCDLCSSRHLKKTLWTTHKQKKYSWLFIMLYLLHILLWSSVGHSSVALPVASLSFISLLTLAAYFTEGSLNWQDPKWSLLPYAFV